MQHFDQKEEQQKKKVGRKQAPQGPHDISFYFPDIPEGMDFRDFVSVMCVCYTLVLATAEQWLTYCSCVSPAKNTESANARGIFVSSGHPHGHRAGVTTETLSPEEITHLTSHGR